MMIPPARLRPNGRHLAQTRTCAEVASDAEDEAVEESGWTTGGEDNGEGACEANLVLLIRDVSRSFIV